jgi:hypothetical protein
LKIPYLSKLETTIITQFQELAILDYLAFSNTNHQPDELFIHQIQTWFKGSFEDIVTTLKTKHNWDRLSHIELQTLANHTYVSVESINYDHLNYQDLNKRLKQNKSKLRIQWSMQSKSREFVVGLAQEETIDEFLLYKITHQLCSSFGLFIPMVAMINNNEILLRKACITKMLELKWRPIWTNLNHYQQLENVLIHDDASLIGVKLRNKTLLGYKNCSNFEAQFKQDCEENVLYHEFGHAVIQNHCISHPAAAIAETFQVFSEDNIIIVLLEILADIAPVKGNKKGVLTHIFSHADSAKAKRCLAMYFADIWFFDTQETYMFNYSEILALIFINYPYANKDTFLTDFSLTKDSKLAQLISLVENLVTEFSQKFLTPNQLTTIKSQRDYVITTKVSQEIFQQLKQENLESIITFINKNQDLMRYIYAILDSADLYHESASIRQSNLFKKLIRSLV